MAGQPERQRNARQTQATMALRDPAAAEDVEVVAYIHDRFVDAEVKRIDWAKTDARATSEKALENVEFLYTWPDDGKIWNDVIAEESLTLRDGSPFRTKDYEFALPAARKKTKTKRLVELVEAGQTYAADEELVCAKKSKSKNKKNHLQRPAKRKRRNDIHRTRTQRCSRI